MAKQKYFDGTKWVQVAPSMAEFTTHLAEKATLTTLGHVKAETDAEGNLILPVLEASNVTSTDGNVQTDIDNLKLSVSDGKIVVRNAITGKGGVVADADSDGIPTFQELANGVNDLGSGHAVRKIYENSYWKIETVAVDNLGNLYYTVINSTTGYLNKRDKDFNIIWTHHIPSSMHILVGKIVICEELDLIVIGSTNSYKRVKMSDGTNWVGTTQITAYPREAVDEVTYDSYRNNTTTTNKYDKNGGLIWSVPNPAGISALFYSMGVDDTYLYGMSANSDYIYIINKSDGSYVGNHRIPAEASATAGWIAGNGKGSGVYATGLSRVYYVTGMTSAQPPLATYNYSRCMTQLNDGRFMGSFSNFGGVSTTEATAVIVLEGLTPKHSIPFVGVPQGGFYQHSHFAIDNNGSVYFGIYNFKQKTNSYQLLKVKIDANELF